MSVKSDKAEAKAAAIESLVTGYGVVPGTSVHVSIDSVSASGMSRTMRLFVVSGGEFVNITWLAARALGEPVRDDKFGRRVIRVGGCGMDMAFHIVNSLSYALHNDGYALTKRDI